MFKHIIAVVDDDESTRKSTTLLIESFGYRAVGFESAEALLKSSQLHDISCLIIDVRLSGINGLQLQSHLAAAGHKIPVIFITASEDAASRRRAIQTGAVALIARGVILSNDGVFEPPPLEPCEPISMPISNPTLKDTIRQRILAACQSANWQLGGPRGAAARLGLQRTTLFYMMKRLGIARPAATGRTESRSSTGISFAVSESHR